MVAIALVAMLGMVGLVVDGGYAFAQQRGSQNGADSAATAGALVLAKNLPFRALGQTLPYTDTDVYNAVNTAATSNNLGTVNGYYTDLNGNLLESNGSQASGASDAARVGGGVIPTGTWGVQVAATRSFNTFFSRVVGINSITATTSSTVVAGYVENAGANNVLPVTIPLDTISCDNNGNFYTVTNPSTGQPIPWPLNAHVILPLCKGASGNVGWLDWTPPNGGTSELINCINNPCNPAVPVPSWQYVSQTGNISASGLQDAINKWAGQVVLIPFFDNSCQSPNTDANNSACPAGSGGGTGQNNWYHMPLFFGLQLDSPQAAWINGNQSAVCGTQWNGVGCITGTIVSYIGPNVTVGAGTGTSLDAYSATGVQLIR